MAVYTTPSIVFHLRNTFDDARFVEEFRHAGIQVKTASQLADVVTALHAPMTSFARVFALAPAQHGGITLLELLTDMALLDHVKVILIDAEQDIQTAIKALRLGAADYFTAGMTSQEVASRIEFLLNCEAKPDINPPEVELPAVIDLPADSISINPNLRAIRKGDMWVSLSPIEWRLFEQLIQNRGRVVNFDELVLRGLNRNRVTSSETSLLRLHMSRLRTKLNAHFDRDLNIITLRGRGYMLT
jgi:DNA-binding response OmpR family regulator